MGLQDGYILVVSVANPRKPCNHRDEQDYDCDDTESQDRVIEEISHVVLIGNHIDEPGYAR